MAEFESMEILTSFTNFSALTIFFHAAIDVSVLHIPSIIPITSLRCPKISTFPGYDSKVSLMALDVALIEHPELYSLQVGDSPLGPLLMLLLARMYSH